MTKDINCRIDTTQGVPSLWIFGSPYAFNQQDGQSYIQLQLKNQSSLS
jgi:hypothetical protein